MATVRILRSTTPGAIPASLVSGQIAINEADSKLFFRNSAGAVTEFTGSGGSGTTEVLEYSSPAGFPATGSAARIYVSTTTGRLYRWQSSGSVYVEIGGRGVSGPDGGSFA
jgi:hypothetical protein